MTKWFFVLLLAACSSAFAEGVAYFGLPNQPVIGAPSSVTVCTVGEAKTLTAQMRHFMQVHQASASQLKAHFAKDFALMGKSEKCQYQAQKLGVLGFPVFVFDGRYAIYGTRVYGKTQMHFEGALSHLEINGGHV